MVSGGLGWEVDRSLYDFCLVFYVPFEETRAEGSGLDKNQKAVTRDVPTLALNRKLGSEV